VWDLFLSCANPSLAGSSTETGNIEPIAVRASIVTSTGTPAAGVAVFIRKRNFLKEIIDINVTPAPDAITGQDGSFIADSLDTGDYLIEVDGRAAGAALLSCSLRPGDSVDALPADTLRPAASITGVVSSLVKNRERFFARIFGLSRCVEIDPVTMRYTIGSVPAGTYTIQVVPGARMYRPVVVDSVAAAAGTATSIDTVYVCGAGDENLVYWQFRKECLITAGAGIAEPVYGFPLLIRLDSAGFPFDEAQFDGRDIRFTKTGGTPVAFEIEKWDAINGSAAVWVLMDTVFAGGSGQSLFMYWGNSLAQSRSSGSSVFSGANRFAASWHLERDLRDATAHVNHGTNFNTVSIDGVAGDGRYFDGSGDYITFGNGPSLNGITDSITVSCWIKTSIAVDSNVSIIRHDGHFTALQTATKKGYAWVAVWRPDLIANQFPWDSVFNDNTWHHYAVMYSGSAGITIYKDGVLFDVEPGITGTLPEAAAADFILGGSEHTGEYFMGILDEVRVSTACRSGAWIKLCYENQKPGSTVVRFR
jgi:hypothetical protein